MMVKNKRNPFSMLKSIRTFAEGRKIEPLVPFVTRKGKDLSPEAWAALQAAAEDAERD